jgi:Flp pilus assembly pilin Flp
MESEGSFHRFGTMLRAVLEDEQAQTIVEYALVIALVSMVALVTIRALGRRVANSINNADNSFS